MDNNQPNNQWQNPQNPNQPTTSSWATGNLPNNQTSPQVNSGAQSPIGYQPPVSYGTLNNQSPQPQSPEGIQQTPVNNPVQSQPVGLNTQPVQSAPAQFNQPTQQAPVGMDASAINQSTPQSPAGQNPQAPGQQPTEAKPKQPMSQNQILFIITGLVSLVALSVIVICVVLVVS